LKGSFYIAWFLCWFVGGFFFPQGAKQVELTVADILLDQSIYMSFAGFCFLTSYGGLCHER